MVVSSRSFQRSSHKHPYNPVLFTADDVVVLPPHSPALDFPVQTHYSTLDPAVEIDIALMVNVQYFFHGSGNYPTVTRV